MAYVSREQTLKPHIFKRRGKWWVRWGILTWGDEGNGRLGTFAGACVLARRWWILKTGTVDDRHNVFGYSAFAEIDAYRGRPTGV